MRTVLLTLSVLLVASSCNNKTPEETLKEVQLENAQLLGEELEDVKLQVMGTTINFPIDANIESGEYTVVISTYSRETENSKYNFKSKHIGHPLKGININSTVANNLTSSYSNIYVHIYGNDFSFSANYVRCYNQWGALTPYCK